MTKRETQMYQKAVHTAQAELSPTERSIARLLHMRPAWKIMGLLESTLFRSTPMLIGYTLALTGGLLALGTAYAFNYHIESLQVLFVLFVFGYFVGIIVDYLRLLLR